MDEATQKVIGDIQQKIQSHLSEIAKLKKTANMVADLAGQGPIYSDTDEDASTVGPNRADAYYGKPLATAVREYLEFRRQAVPAEEILKGLEQGGFDFDALDWPTAGRLRFLAISISKNTVVFHRLPNGMWGLNAWYSEATQKRSAKVKRRVSKRKPRKRVSKGRSHPATKIAGKGKTEAAPADAEKEKGSAADTTEPSTNE